MPRDGAPTRTRILDIAERLAIEEGFAATPLDRIIGEANTSKGAFFHHFASKNDLALALVERYAASDVAHLQRGLAAAAAGGSAAGRLLAFVDFFVDEADELMAAQSSCLYVAALTERQLIELGTTDPIVGAIRAWREAIVALLEAAFAEGGTSGAAEDTWDLPALADHVFVTFEGSFLLCRATGEASHMRRQLGALRALLAAVLDPQRRPRPRPSS